MLGVASCGEDDPEPRRAPTPPATSSAATSPTTEAAPTLPLRASDHSPSGAKAFAAYFIEVLNYSQSTGDTSVLEGLGTSKCAGCGGYVDKIRATYDAGGSIDGGQLQVGKIRDLPADYGAEWGGFASGTATPQVIKDGSGGKESYDGGKFGLFVYTIWVDDAWAVQWIRTPS